MSGVEHDQGSIQVGLDQRSKRAISGWRASRINPIQISSQIFLK